MTITPLVHKGRPLLLAFTLIASISVAGCVDDSLIGSDGETPIARLASQPGAAFADEPMRFDASESSDPNGAIVTYSIDFGDGTTADFDADENTSIEHAYEEPGTYAVSLVVTDDGAGQDAPLAGTTSLAVSVHDRIEFRRAVAAAAPLNPSLPANATQDVPVDTGAASFRLYANATSTVLIGGSEIRVALLSPSGEVLAEDTVSLDAGASGGVSFSGAIVDNGTHRVEIEAIEGAADVGGTVEVLYGADVAEAKLDDEADDNQTSA